MHKKKKKKIKIKKKSFIITIISIFLIVYIPIKTINIISKSISKHQLKTEEKKEEKTKKEEKKSNKEEINKELSYYNNDYLDRYLKYKHNNKGLTDEQIIKNVNMNLDLKQYIDIKKAKNLNNIKILVNKYYYLEEDYVPDNLEEINNEYALDGMELVKEAKDAFEELAKDAKKENLNIIAMSCYRNYDYQIDLYNNYKRKDGKDIADTYSGRPGHSEHQTGLAVDVYNEEEDYTNFEKTEEFNWMIEHAHEYGYILRFPKDKEQETGYHFESWHYRYVGKDIAKYIKEHNISFEEYYATIIKDW